MIFPILINISMESNMQEYPLTVECDIEEIELISAIEVHAETVDVPIYDGEYTVTPLAASEVVLETKDKLCEDDITVLKIPRYSTGNEYGTTFYIGEG